MAEYSKKTVADLVEILKSRGLASSGKKAELIARLTEADKAAESQNAEPEHQPEPMAESASTTQAAPNVEEPQSTGVSGDNAVGQAAEQSADTAAPAPAVEEKNFGLNLAASDIDKEMEKRKARAERFKTGGQANADAETTETATADTDALKNMERAKRFGTGTTAIGMLDSALSSERGSRGKKRTGGPVEESAVLDDPGLKQNFKGRGRNGRDKRRNGPPGSKPTGIVKSGGAAFNSEKDKQAAEARKKKFASG